MVDFVTSTYTVAMLSLLGLTAAQTVTPTLPALTESPGDHSAANMKINLTWSANVSVQYPSSSPLEIQLGTILRIKCPDNSTSNIWIQTHYEQYEQCKCEADGLEQVDSDIVFSCDPSETNVKHICQNEVVFEVKTLSQVLYSALNFQADMTYYLISYSPGEKKHDGFSDNDSGGQCLQGFKMALYVQPLGGPTPTASITQPSTSTLSTAATTDHEVTVTYKGPDDFEPVLTTNEVLFTEFPTSGTPSLFVVHSELKYFVFVMGFFFSLVSRYAD